MHKKNGIVHFFYCFFKVCCIDEKKWNHFMKKHFWMDCIWVVAPRNGRLMIHQLETRAKGAQPSLIWCSGIRIICLWRGCGINNTPPLAELTALRSWWKARAFRGCPKSLFLNSDWSIVWKRSPPWTLGAKQKRRFFQDQIFWRNIKRFLLMWCVKGCKQYNF